MRRGDSGQSTIEFVLTLIFLMGLIFFFLQLSMVFGFGNYAHYATFMAARAYLSSGTGGEAEQKSRAERVAARMLTKGGSGSGDRFPSIAKGQGGGNPNGVKVGPGDQFDRSDRALSWQQGVRYTFRSRLFIVPFAGASRTTQNTANGLTLTSESWLGREPSAEECSSVMRSRGSFYDNGC